MSLSSARNLSRGGDFGWYSPPLNILRKKPIMRMRRNPSRRSLLLNVMPGSTDPGLSPSSSGKTMSPRSHCSSWSSASELIQPRSHISFRQGVKIDQLIKVNEAIAIELADLESGKEKWLGKLKLLEARICSNIANIDKWAAENTSKPASSIEAIDNGIVDKKKVGEGFVLEAPSAWRLSLADLASIFKSSSVENENSLPKQHQGHDTALSYGMDLYFDEHEDTMVLAREGSSIPKSEIEHLFAGCGIDVVISSPNQTDSSHEDAKCTSGHVDEAPDFVSRGGRISVPNGPNDGVVVGNGLLKAESAELEFRADNTLRRRVRPSEDPKGRLAFDENHLFSTDLELMSEIMLEPKTPARRAGGVEVMSSQEQGTVGNCQSTKDVPAMIGEENYSPTESKAQLQDALIEARKELQKLEQHIITTEKEKDHFESSLRTCEHTLEEAKLDADKLRSQKELLQGMLTDCEASFESARLALLKEKDENKQKTLSAMQSLEDMQQNVIVLERQKLVLESELNHFRHAFEKAKQESLGLKKEKDAIELDLTGCKQTLKEAQDNSILFQKERDDLARESIDLKENMAKSRHQYVMLEKEKVELHNRLTELKYTFEKASEKCSVTERERSNLEAAYSALMIELEKSEQQALMLENENSMLETVLAEFRRMLDGTQQQLMALEGEKEYMKSELTETKQAFEEERQHALSLEEEKVALELGSCEYKQVIQETEQHVLTLQSALEGTLQRADAVDHQVQRLRIEKKRLSENNENLQAYKDEQDTNVRNLEAQRDLLRAELESYKNKQEAAQEALTKVNSLYALAMENAHKEEGYIEALQHQLSLLEKENVSLKVMLENSTLMSNSLEAEQKALQMNLKEAECSLQKAMQELNALGAEYANEMAALRIENSANECQIQALTEELQQKKTVEIERLCQVEANANQLLEKLNGQESQLRSITSELVSVKLELAGKQVEIEDERSTNNIVIQDLNAKVNRSKDLEQELSIVRGEQTGLRGAMKDEMVKKKELMQKLQTKQTRIIELESALEFAKVEQSDMLVNLENERMAKEAAFEELAAIKSQCEELEEDFHKLHTEVQVRERDNEDKEGVMQALLEEQSKCRELEEALELKTAEQETTNAAWENERDASECLLRELEKERMQRMQLEEQLKVSKAKEEHTRVAMQDERAALENLKKQIDTQEAKCRDLETALNVARKEQERREQETISKKVVMHELWDHGKRSVEQEHCKVMQDDKRFAAISEAQRLRLEVSELLIKSKKLEQIVSSLEREGGDSSSNEAIQSAITQEVSELQSCVEDIESRLADAGYIMMSKVKGKEKEKEKNEDQLLAVYVMSEKGKEKKEKDEDELLALLEESSTIAPRSPALEAHIPQACDTSTDVARQAEEEIRRLKESTETFHQALFDAHYTALSDVSGLLVELKSLKHLLNDKTMISDRDRKEEKKRGSLAIPTAALSTSALAAIGLLALLKFPKNNFS